MLVNILTPDFCPQIFQSLEHLPPSAESKYSTLLIQQMYSL